MNEQDTIFYIHEDHPGSFDVISNPDGTVKERYNYDPCVVRQSIAKVEGRRRNPSDWSYDNVSSSFYIDRGFTGHEHRDQFGLINMLSEAKSRSLQASGNGRVYDPLMAMFLSPDNFVQSPDLTQNFNRYTYCLNNPLKYIDPSGFTYKAYMNSVYGEGNYWYRGQAPGTWTDWESFHYGGGGGGGFYGSRTITASDINLLWKSTYGGSWSNHSGINYFNSDAEGFIAGCVYNEINDSWGYTVGGSLDAAMQRYDNFLTASLDGGGVPQKGDKIAAGLASGWVVGLAEPTPAGEIAMAVVTTAAVLYYGPDLVKKMQAEIDNVLTKSPGPQGYVYELRATRSGPYPNLNTGGTTILNVGDVWKYGQTTQGFGRYSQGDLRRMGLEMYPIFPGNQVQILVQEKIMIYGYYFQHGHRPPGNPIFR